MFFIRCFIYCLITILKLPLLILKALAKVFLLLGGFLLFSGTFFWIGGWEWDYLLIGFFVNAGINFLIPFVVEFLIQGIDLIREFIRYRFNPSYENFGSDTYGYRNGDANDYWMD